MSQVKTLIEGIKSLPNGKIELQKVIDNMPEVGFPLILLTLSLTLIAIPIPKIPPVNFFFAFPFLWLGWQMMAGRETPSLPYFLKTLTIQVRHLKLTADKVSAPLDKIENMARPIWSGIVNSPYIDNIIGVGVLIMTTSILLPLPCTDSPPAFFIALMCLGKIYSDGRLIIAGLLGGGLWIVLLFSLLEEIAEWLYRLL